MAFFPFLLLAAQTALAHPFDRLGADLARRGDLVDVTNWDGLATDFRYATRNNFTGRNVYGPFRRCFVHAEAAPKLRLALEALRARRPGWKLRAFDCLRPVRAQAQLYEIVRGTPEQKYVVSPAVGSLHSYGFAVDVSLSDEAGQEVDMGTGFDFFGVEAEPAHEAELLRDGRLTARQLEHRRLLREVMRAGGYRSISTEWWHFDALDGASVRGGYEPVP